MWSVDHTSTAYGRDFSAVSFVRVVYVRFSRAERHVWMRLETPRPSLFFEVADGCSHPGTST